MLVQEPVRPLWLAQHVMCMYMGTTVTSCQTRKRGITNIDVAFKIVVRFEVL